MAKNRVKLRWPEHVSKPFAPVTQARQRTFKPSPEALEALAVVAERFAPHANTPRKARDAASLANEREREARLRHNAIARASLSYQDKITASTSTWDRDNGAGVKRKRPMVAEPTGYTARERASRPVPPIGLAPETLDNLHAQRAWKR